MTLSELHILLVEYPGVQIHSDKDGTSAFLYYFGYEIDLETRNPELWDYVDVATLLGLLKVGGALALQGEFTSGES